MNPLYRGDTRDIKVKIVDDEGEPVNLAGHSLWVTLKANPTDADALAALQVSAVMPADANSAAGIGYITISAEGVAPGRYYYDIQWVQPGSPPIVKTIDAGKVRVLQDITIST